MSTRKRKHPDKASDDDSDCVILNPPPSKKQRLALKQVNNNNNNPVTKVKKTKKIKKKKRQWKHHPGGLEVDYDCWPDHDERCHGRIDTNSNRREYPDSFVWSCCGKHGDEMGCEYRSNPPTPISIKYATSPEPSLDEAEYYHTGELEVEYDRWPDHDEDCHGPIDTKTNRREYPDGFVWSCCGKNGTYSEGCCKQGGDEDDDEDDDDI